MRSSTPLQKVHTALANRRSRRRWARELDYYAPAQRLELVAMLDRCDGEGLEDVRTELLRTVA